MPYEPLGGIPPLFIESLIPAVRSTGSRFDGTYIGGLLSLSMLEVTSEPAIRFEKDYLRPEPIGLAGLYPPPILL